VAILVESCCSIELEPKRDLELGEGGEGGRRAKKVHKKKEEILVKKGGASGIPYESHESRNEPKSSSIKRKKGGIQSDHEFLPEGNRSRLREGEGKKTTWRG